MENPIKQTPGTLLMYYLQSRKGGTGTKPALEAEARLAEHAHRAGIYMLSVGLRDPVRTASPGMLTPRASPWHCTVQVLTYLPTFFNSPNRYSVPRALFSSVTCYS